MAKTKKEQDLRFGRFGTVSFTKTSKVNDFIAYLEKGRVMATQCAGCGASYFPPRADCCGCLSSDMDWKEIDGPGRLLTHSRLLYAPQGFDQDLPYTIAVLDFGEFKVFGRIDDSVEPDEIKIGMLMKVRANGLPNGQLNYVFVKA
jgi:uncharacterized OB-fold protein